jgi:hypothetical protein
MSELLLLNDKQAARTYISGAKLAGAGGSGFLMLRRERGTMARMLFSLLLVLIGSHTAPTGNIYTCARVPSVYA